jgi:CubicO group peptidase (beta-lactamase class C family)
MARLFDLSAQGKLRKSISPGSFAHEYLPAYWGADDPKRRQIRISHLLTMCSGLDPYDGPYRDLDAYYQTVLSRRVEAPPEKVWCYSSTSVDLLSFILENVSGRPLGQFFNEEIAGPIGIDPLEWPAFTGRSGGSGGPGGGPHYLARELARVGYLTLRGGQWYNGIGPASIVSQQRVNTFTQWAPILDGAHFREKNFWVVQPGSQNYYGHLWWTNRTQQSLGPNVPADAYYMSGYSMRTCVVIPSLDLVIARLGSNRELNNHIEFYGELIGRIVAAVTS